MGFEQTLGLITHPLSPEQYAYMCDLKKTLDAGVSLVMSKSPSTGNADDTDGLP